MVLSEYYIAILIFLVGVYQTIAEIKLKE